MDLYQVNFYRYTTFEYIANYNRCVRLYINKALNIDMRIPIHLYSI